MSDNQVKTNPIIRLNEILFQAKQIAPRTNLNEDLSYRDVWCRVFEIEDHSSETALIELIHRLLELRKLFDETKAKLLTIEGINETLFVEPVTTASNVVSNLNAVNQLWRDYHRFLADTVMNSMKYVEHLLSSMPDIEEVKIPDDEVTSIISETIELYNQIHGSSLPSELKSDLLNLLDELEQAMREYRIRGAARIREAIGKSIGTLAVNKDELIKEKDSEEIKSLSKLLERIEHTYSSATKIQPLLQAASSIIPMLTDK